MKKITKIIIIAIVCLLGATCFVWAPITFMIVGGLVSSFITSITSDEEYIKKASQNPIVKQYLETWPNYTTYQSNEFLGWRIIYFDVKDGPSMYVKISNLHEEVKVHMRNNFTHWSGDSYDKLLSGKIELTHRPATSLFSSEGCLSDADVEKSDFLNGNLDIGDEPWPCSGSGRLFYLNATSDIQTMIDCVGLYEMREKELETNNDNICKRLEIPQCNAVQIVSFQEFQKKYCDFW